MSDHKSTKEIKVGLNFGGKTIPVGRLASRDLKIYFEYDGSFIESGLNISPLKLPLEYGLLTSPTNLFEGLPGVFNDSLPDGWGRLLFHRYAKSQGLMPEEFSPLDRLANVGFNGLGALVYEPDYSKATTDEKVNLDVLANQMQEVIEGEAENVLAELIALNGSSAGARPKALIGIDHEKKHIIQRQSDLPEGHEHWIVKFANSGDGMDAGAIEYVYALMAKDAGLKMTDTHLFSSKRGAGYFATKRFDRNKNKRMHMHTVSGLLHADFRTPALDYENLLALTMVLTKDVREVKKMFQLAVFNVLSHNRDDHGKNVSFLMDENGDWKLSPAYDLTFSSGPNGHQSTMVMGEGQSPSIRHLSKLGLENGLGKSDIDIIIDQTQNALNQWKTLAQHHGVTSSNIKLIQSRISAIRDS